MLNIQPMIPITVNKDWNIITRTILPLDLAAGSGPGQAAPSAWATSSSRPFFHPASPGPVA